MSRRTGRMLVALALFTLSTPLFEITPSAQTLPNETRPAPQSGRNQPTRPSDEKDQARLKLGISKAQQKQIEALFARTSPQAAEISRNIRDLYRQLHALYDRYDFDRDQAHAIRKQIVDLHARRVELFADNEEKLRKILTRTQFEKLRALMREAEKKRWHERSERHEHEPDHPDRQRRQ